MYYPVMATLIAKRKKNQLYYYVVESARRDGRPRIVHQTYLGNAQKVAALLKDRTAPLPVSASRRELGLPAALWLAAQQSGVFGLLESLWDKPRSGPSPAHYLLLAAFHRICAPGPKTEASDWYRQTVLHSLWGFEPERFSSQAFWDCFEQLLPEKEAAACQEERDPLEEAQAHLLGLWKEKQLVSQRLLAYDTTNFHTYIATTNTRNHLAQRGHNKQGRHDLRQVGLCLVRDGESGLALCHHVYPGNVADSEEFPVALERLGRLLARHQIPPQTVTLIFDKGTAALANTVLLEDAGLGWISALPWNQAPTEFRQRPVEDLPALSSAQPGVRAAAEKLLVHGKEYLCVLKYSASFAAEQLHSLSASLAKALGAMKRLAVEVARPTSRLTPPGIEAKIARWLSAPFLAELVRYELREETGGWRLAFQVEHAALQQLITHRLGRTLLLTNHGDWTAELVVSAYASQQELEQVFRGLKQGDWLNWQPMHHWTDSKIRVHAFYCLLGLSLLHYVLRQARAFWPQLSVEKLQEELEQIQQFVLLYPALGGGPHRTATVLATQSLVQRGLVDTLGLQQFA
jgi:DDE family transposase